MASCALFAPSAVAQSDLTGWVDRIEGDMAVVIVQVAPDELIERDVPLAALAPGVSEGDRLIDGQVIEALREPTADYVRALHDLIFDRPPKRTGVAGDAPKRDPGLMGGRAALNSRRPGRAALSRAVRTAATLARSRVPRGAGA